VVVCSSARRSLDKRGDAVAVYDFCISQSTGLMSTTGVPSMASMGPIRNRFFTILRTVTGEGPRDSAGQESGSQRHR